MSNTNDFEHRGEEALNQSRERKANEEKLCPFLTKPGAPVICTPKCKLYRKQPKGYECTFQELRSIAWNTNKKNQSPR